MTYIGLIFIIIGCLFLLKTNEPIIEHRDYEGHVFVTYFDDGKVTYQNYTLKRNQRCVLEVNSIVLSIEGVVTKIEQDDQG